MFVIKVKITPIEVLPFIERPRIAESRDESEWEDGGLTPEQQRARSEVGPPYNSTVQYSTVQYTRAQQQLHIRIQNTFHPQHNIR